MRIKFYTLIIGLISGISSQAQTYEWALNVGGAGAATTSSVAVGSDGSVYSTGKFTGSCDFDQGASSVILSSSGTFGQYDIFVQKSDSNGNFLWAKKFGASVHDQGYGISVDPNQNIVITGHFEGTVDFDPGAGTHQLISQVGTRDIFILKLRPNGDFVWAKQIKTINDSRGYSIVTDDKGGVYTSGYFQGNSTDFNPGTGVYTLHSGGTNVVGGFIQKLDSNGNFKWAKALVKTTGTGTSQVLKTKLSPSGHLYSTGEFSGRIDFNPNSPTQLITAVGGKDIFVHKMDTAGNFDWVKTIGSSSDEISYSLATDWEDNVMITGYFSNTLDFDPGAATFNLSSNLSGSNARDIFIQKLDSLGNFVWAKKMGMRNTDIGYGIATDAVGNIYNTGIYSETIDFDPSFFSATTLTLSGISDVYLQKLAPDGTFRWAKKIGAGNADFGYDVMVDSKFNIYTAGEFYGTADFNPSSSATDNISSSTYQDGFVQKLSQCVEVKSVDVISACGSLLWNGTTYSASNTSAVAKLTSSTGCDSLVFLKLTLKDSSSSVATHSACNSFTWIDGITYTASNNTATTTLTNSEGCDSVITLNLTINSINKSVSVSGITITAALTGATYQWVNCNTSYSSISGATSRSYTPSANGNYACIVSDGSCSDTTACTTINSVGIKTVEVETISVYPNPVQNRLTIELDRSEFVKLDILDISGKLVFSSTQFNSNIEVSHFAKGMYSIRIITESGIKIGRFVKD